MKKRSKHIWSNKGSVFEIFGKPDEALKAYEKAIELEPDCDLAWFNRACLYSVKGDKEKALSSLEKAIELDPRNKEKVKDDEDFEFLWCDEDFIKLVA